MVGMRAGVKMGDVSLVDICIKDGLTDAFHNYHMGITGEPVLLDKQINKACISLNVPLLVKD